MITRWQQGRTTIDLLLLERRLDQVKPSRDVADLLLEPAHRHLVTAVAIAGSDPVSGFQIMYDAARKGLAPILAN